MRCHEKFGAWLESNGCNKGALSTGALFHRLLTSASGDALSELHYRVAADVFAFDALLEDIGGLIDGCLVSFQVQQRARDGKSVCNGSADN
jgi:hypothetical protein